MPHLERLAAHFQQLIAELNDAAAGGDPARLKALNREHARLAPVLQRLERYKALRKEKTGLDHLLESPEVDMRMMAQEELPKLLKQIQALEAELRLALLPVDPNDDRNILLEIRAGTGGDEAGLFAADLLRMYTRFAESRRFAMETLSLSAGERGAIKEAIVQISGDGVWSCFKYERGVHRVQRVPATEASGRIHTSTATVAVLPEADEVDIDINPADLRIDTFRASGAGGQHINKTDSAVRITHLPTGFFVACQEERSQIKNRARAMKLLRSRLLEMAQEKQAAAISKDRKGQVGSGERSEKIRTYNYPQDRVTDHRINANFHNLPAILEGKLDAIVLALRQDEQARQLAALADEGFAAP